MSGKSSVDAGITVSEERPNEGRKSEFGPRIVGRDVRCAEVAGKDETSAVVELFPHEAGAQFLRPAGIGRATEFREHGEVRFGEGNRARGLGRFGEQKEVASPRNGWALEGALAKRDRKSVV